MNKPESSPPSDDFLKEAEKPRSGFFSEYIDFITTNRKWWLIPILAGLLLIGGFLILGGTSMAPLIYALF
jgi:hypothetical protein